MQKIYNRLSTALPDDDILSQCIHCGLCLSVCPTYELTKLETSSPRGRIRLINSVAKGELPLTKGFAEEMNFCLDCQACETACPAGVKYGVMVEAARVEVDEAGVYGTVFSRIIKKISLKYILASKRNLKLIAKIIYYYQNSFFRNFIKKILKIFSKKLYELENLSPEISKNFSDEIIDEVTPAVKEEKYRVAFSTGCLMNVMFADINKDTVDVLSSAGCKVITPKEQHCCGSLHAHHGDINTAKKLAKKNIEIFEKHNFDFLISNSAGCGAFMKDYAHIFSDDPEFRERGKNFAKKVKDFSQFLFEENIDLPLNKISESVSYHDACHLAHSQKIVLEPRAVLQKIPGLVLQPLEEATWCCGSAGLYNIIRHKDSLKILERKMKNISAANAEVIVAGNPGCIAQIKYGAKKFNINIKVKHPSTILKEALSE